MSKKIDEKFELAKKKYSVTEEELDGMYKSIKESIFENIRPETKRAPIAMVMGGQPGAGKSKLVLKARNDFSEMGRDVVVLDVDAYRGFFKNAAQLAQEYPEYYSDITDVATGYVMRRILEEATIPNGYNFIFEGTLASPQIIQTIRKFNPNYDIRAKLMAVSKIESTLSIFERYLETKKRIGIGRLTTIAAHDVRFDGFTKTATELEGMGVPVEVYKRASCIMAYPIFLYGTDNERSLFPSVIEALNHGRTESHAQCLRTAPARLKTINEDLHVLDRGADVLEELKKLNDIFDRLIVPKNSSAIGKIRRLSGIYNGFAGEDGEGR